MRALTRRRNSAAFVVVSLVPLSIAVACSASSPSGTPPADTPPAQSGGGGSGGIENIAGSDDGAGGFDVDRDGGVPDPGCDPPDVLMLLDRTFTMHRTPSGEKPIDGPDYATSKWYQAIAAIEQVAKAPLDQTVRFGLELWPRDPGGPNTCTTLAAIAENGFGLAGNQPCDVGEILVKPDLGTGAAIQTILDPEVTRLCWSTPTGTAILTGSDYLAAHAVAGREQIMVLVTDGADWDESCPEPNPLPIVRSLAMAGVKTYVVGFFDPLSIGEGGNHAVGEEFLNDLACAGQTAKGFPESCTLGADGYVAKDPTGPTVFFEAGNTDELAASLEQVTQTVCCDCGPR